MLLARTGHRITIANRQTRADNYSAGPLRNPLLIGANDTVKPLRQGMTGYATLRQEGRFGQTSRTPERRRNSLWQKAKPPQLIELQGLQRDGGGARIRTLEGVASRFTVCPR